MTPKVRKILEGKKLLIYRIFERELKGYGRKRIDFNDVAREVGCSRKTVSYHYKQFKKKGLVEVQNGEMLIPSRRQKKAT